MRVLGVLISAMIVGIVVAAAREQRAACDQQHSYLSEVDQNTAQASDGDDTLTRCLDLADSGN